MSNFLGGTPCAPVGAGHRTLPPIHQRESRKAEPQAGRGSGRSEDPHREATCGVGPVTGSAGSESRSDRGGRHPASSPEGLLVLIPSRGPHPCFRFGIGPAGSRAGTESQPACRRGRGSRVADGFRGGVGRPETQPVRRPRIGAQAATGSPEAAWDPGHRRFRPEMIWIRTTAGLPEVERDPDSNEVSTPRGDSRRRPGGGGGGRRRSWPDEVGVITTSTRRPLGAHTTR